MTKPLLVTTLLFLASLSGCAARNSSMPALASQPVTQRTAHIYWGATGRQATWSDLLSAAAAADAVLIGENHGHALGLETAASLWEETLPMSPNAALCLEFFERDDQSRIDDYLAGFVTDERFRSRTGRNDSNYPPGHRRMVDAARQARRPVIAANAPRPLVTLARQGGYDSFQRLTAEQRRMARIPDQAPAGRYRADFDAVMSSMSAAHGGAPAPSDAERVARLDAAFRAQSLWDWTMADSVAKALDGGARPVFLVVGRFHVDFEGGLAQAIDHIRPGTKRVIVTFVDAWADQLQPEDRGRGDFVIYVGPGEEAPITANANATAAR